MSGPVPTDHKGKRFGRLVAVAVVGSAPVGGAVWHCECDCGGFLKVSAASLVRGATKSCGCLYRDTRSSSMRKAGKVFAGPRRLPR